MSAREEHVRASFKLRQLEHIRIQTSEWTMDDSDFRRILRRLQQQRGGDGEESLVKLERGGKRNNERGS